MPVYLVNTTSATPPSQADIKAGTGVVAGFKANQVALLGANSFTGGLTQASPTTAPTVPPQYWVHMFQELPGIAMPSATLTTGPFRFWAIPFISTIVGSEITDVLATITFTYSLGEGPTGTLYWVGQQVAVGGAFAATPTAVQLAAGQLGTGAAGAANLTGNLNVDGMGSSVRNITGLTQNMQTRFWGGIGKGDSFSIIQVTTIQTLFSAPVLSGGTILPDANSATVQYVTTRAG